ncbi:MAG: ABC transporter permease [Boseongicola sp.]|nr:MAG: ABC transporter permease [Boseongicola sp.]
MLKSGQNSTLASGAFTFFNLTFHNAVRGVSTGHRNAVLAIVLNIVQTVVMIGAFFFLMDMLGLRGSAVRGDFLLYIMSGIFVFITHIKSVGAVAGAGSATASMLKHLTMNQPIAVCSAALSALYNQTISVAAILLVYHLVWKPVEFHDPVGAVAMFILAWLSGCCVGLVLLGLSPWFPQLTGILKMIYTRANMFASGKMFLANTLPAHMLVMFDWNPLFHIIDQGRGFIFVNYNPMKSALMYPIWVSLVLAVIGIIGISYTAKHVSLSWDAAR